MPDIADTIDREAERKLAAKLFNHVWALLGRHDRSLEDDDEMLHAAHASRFHWGRVGEVAQRARGEWQCSRVYATLDRPEPALHHARRCLELCQEGPVEEFDLPFAHEALARAYAVAGDDDRAAEELRLGRELAARIEDEEDRRVVLEDLKTVPLAAV
jgi:hypothetical protein